MYRMIFEMKKRKLQREVNTYNNRLEVLVNKKYDLEVEMGMENLKNEVDLLVKRNASVKGVADTLIDNAKTGFLKI